MKGTTDWSKWTKTKKLFPLITLVATIAINCLVMSKLAAETSHFNPSCSQNTDLVFNKSLVSTLDQDQWMQFLPHLLIIESQILILTEAGEICRDLDVLGSFATARMRPLMRSGRDFDLPSSPRKVRYGSMECQVFFFFFFSGQRLVMVGRG